MIERLSDRIAKAIKKTVRVAGASSSDGHEVTIEQGSEPQKNRVGLGQTDASVPFSKWTEVNPEPKVIKPADLLDANPKPLAPDAVVKIGEHVTIAPSTISGWEARFTRGWTAFDVTLDGKPVKGDQALEAIYTMLREIQSASKGKAK